MGIFGRRKEQAPPAEPSASGWDAIDEALRRQYGDQEPRHVGYQPPMALSDSLQGCSAYDAGDHWHYVTYGLSNLFDQDEEELLDEDGRRVSGWGLELTLRLRAAGDEPPAWPFTVLNQLTKHIKGNAITVRPGVRLDVGPVTGHPHLPDAPGTALTVWAFALDPVLGAIDSPNGHVRFVQAVGVTAQEKQQMVDSSTAAVLAGLAAGNPLLVTDPLRAAGSG